MVVINIETLEKIKRDNAFFDFENFCNKFGCSSKIAFNTAEKITYSDVNIGADKQIYESNESVLISFTVELLKKMGKSNGVISKYSENWIINKNKSYSLYKKIKESAVKNSFKGGFSVEDIDFTKEIIKATFRYNCFSLFILDGVVIAPSDHMEIFVWTATEKLKKNADDLVMQYHSFGLVSC